ncbi:MAG: sigma 54-interacting transcriptional regulator [Pseudomonadota bacterium]
MRELSVAVACDDARVAIRLIESLEFLGVPAIRRAVGEPVTEPVLFTDAAAGDAPDSTAGPLTVHIAHPRASVAAAEGCETLSWPPRYHDVAGVLARARSGAEPAADDAVSALVGECVALRRARSLLRQVADRDVEVLFTGEPGTGRTLAARCLHEQSSRPGAFVPVRCAGIPDELLESELFGSAEAAAPAAGPSRPGRFELARGGTVFLAEVHALSPALQIRLLRAMRERVLEPVGSARSEACDVRVLAATDRDLEELVRQGRFRRDLYDRLSLVHVALPPLRDRADDIRLVAGDFLARRHHRRGESLSLTDPAWAALGAHDWPGNVRELKKILERLAIVFPNAVVDVPDLPARLRGADDRPALAAQPDENDAAGRSTAADAGLPVNGIDLRAHLADTERRLIEQALSDSDAVVARAADRLRVRRTTLVEKMRKYGIRREVA